MFENRCIVVRRIRTGRNTTPRPADNPTGADRVLRGGSWNNRSEGLPPCAGHLPTFSGKAAETRKPNYHLFLTRIFMTRSFGGISKPKTHNPSPKPPELSPKTSFDQDMDTFQ